MTTLFKGQTVSNVSPELLLYNIFCFNNSYIPKKCIDISKSETELRHLGTALIIFNETMWIIILTD